MKKLISLLLVIVLLAGIAVFPVSASAAPTFSDVPADFWAYDAIEEMAEKGIVSGMGNGKFEPNGSVTTAQFATMLVGAFFPEELRGDTRTYPAWYGKTMHIALEEGLLNRLPAIYTFTMAGDVEQWDGRFVNNRMTRKEMAMMLTNYLKDHIPLDEDTFRSIDMLELPDYYSIIESCQDYYYAIQLVYSYGIIRGVDEAGTFDGNGLMTRAQACVVLKKTLDLVQLYRGQWFNNESVDFYHEFDLSYYDESLLPGCTLPNGKQVTEENVQELLYSLKSKYPEGMPSSEDDLYVQTGDSSWALACAAFGYLVTTDLFGDGGGYSCYGYDSEVGTRAECEYAFSQMRPGDSLRLNGVHTVIVLEKNANSIKVVEGNYDGIVHWGREISLNSLYNMWFFGSSHYPYMPVR